MDKNKTGTRIKFLRLSKGLNQQQFGELFSPPAAKSIVSRWEGGISVPSASRLKKIAELGHVSVNYLLNGPASLTRDELESIERKLKDGTATKLEKQQTTEYLLEQSITTQNEIHYFSDLANGEIDHELKIISDQKPGLIDQFTLSYLLSMYNQIRLYGGKKQLSQFRVMVELLDRFIMDDQPNKEAIQDWLTHTKEFLESLPLDRYSKESRT